MSFDLLDPGAYRAARPPAAARRRRRDGRGSGGDELAFRYDRTYDDKRLRAALGIQRPRPVPVDAEYLSRLFTFVNS